MLQKILVVLVGLVMSLVGALSPTGLFASDALPDPIAPLATSAREETLTTVRLADGAAFARVSVLWVEVDGRRVAEDAWGTGAVDEMRFMIGVKSVEGLALALGERLVPINPTDVYTIRTFAGDFAFRGIGTSKATIQLQGTIRTASIDEGDASTKVRTELLGSAETPKKPGEAKRLSYAVLDTGEKLDTVSLQTGGARLFTEESTKAEEASNKPGNLLARWVKIDGRIVNEYTWGDGLVGLIEFQPAAAGSGVVVLAFDGAPSEAGAGSFVTINDFVGEYLVYQVAGGFVRLRLDGYASNFAVNAAGAPAVQTGAGAPVARFSFSPTNPRTSDTITFFDESTDDTLVVFRKWRFGDEGRSIQPQPTFRFTKPGAYVVTLNVTDTDQLSSETSQIITVGNTAPVPDFDFWPKIITTDTTVSFMDHSHDRDGTIVNYTWDFGDGEFDHRPNPTHKFSVGRAHTVRLTTTDDLGGVASLDKILNVKNKPPIAGFTYTPTDPTEHYTLVPFYFIDISEDNDGGIASRLWDFGDGVTSTEIAPMHVYQRPSLYTVRLTVTDSAGASDTTTMQLLIRNRLPEVNFTWTPRDATADQEVTFTSLAFDRDGEIRTYLWDFGDGDIRPSVGPSITKIFDRSGTHMVRHQVHDDTIVGFNSTIKAVGILDALPEVEILVQPNPAFRQMTVTFTDRSFDPEGEAIVNRTWTFPNGTQAYSQVVTGSFNVLGVVNVTLTVTDASGSIGTGVAQVLVQNRPPAIVSASIWPSEPALGQPVYFRAEGIDFDAQPGDRPLEYEFRFGPNDVVRSASSNISRVFNEPVQQFVTVIAYDALDAFSAPPVQLFLNVRYPQPVVAFTWSPQLPVPQSGEPVTFTDLSSVADGHITDRLWTFKDGTAPVATTAATIQHTFKDGGTYFVSLGVVDNRSQQGTGEMPVFVNGKPIAEFEYAYPPPGTRAFVGQPVSFTDASTDPDFGGTIVAWSWDFDDEVVGGGPDTSSLEDPVWEFRRPGKHNVTLTVTDNHGGTATRSKDVEIVNRRPVGSWSGPTVAIANEPITLLATSTDPDNQTAQLTHYWDFGDRTSGTGASVSHSWTSSGTYHVTIVSNDGALNSSRLDPGAGRAVRVYGDHTIQLIIKGVLPTGDPADLSSANFAVRARHGGVAIPSGQIIAHGELDIAVQIPRGTWVRGEQIIVTLEAPGLGVSVSPRSYFLADADSITSDPILVFDIPIRLESTIVAAAGDETTFATTEPIIRNRDQTPQGDPVYRSMSEAFNGSGRVTFADGTPVIGARVDLDVRYVPFAIVSGARNIGPLYENTIIGWCRGGTYTSGANGDYEWTVDTSSSCLTDQIRLHPAGRWEVRAWASYSHAVGDWSPIETIFVDPTGGLLWAAGMVP